MRVLWMVLIYLFIGLTFFSLFGCHGGDTVETVRGVTMGSRYSVIYVPHDNAPERQVVAKSVQLLLDQVDHVASTYKQDSELSALNRASAGWFPASSMLADLLRVGLDVCDFTNGALDITVGELVNLWGFGPVKASVIPPPADVIASARSRLGCMKLSVTGDGIRKMGNVTVDLSSIGQGYGGERVAQWLDAHGIHDYLIDMSGELLAKGRKTDGNLWSIGVERPDREVHAVGASGVLNTVTLSDMAIATSGDYRNFYRVDGKFFSHILDPATGYPVTHDLASVTVLERSFSRADALSTALLVMGPSKGVAFAQQHGIAGLFIIRNDKGFKEVFTGDFERFLTPAL